MEQYKNIIFFSKEAQQKFDESDPDVKKATIRLLQENVEETKMKIERELQKGERWKISPTQSCQIMKKMQG